MEGIEMIPDPFFLAHLAYREEQVYSPLGKREHTDEPAVRPRSRHVGFADPEDPGARAVARLGDRTALEAGVRRCPAGERRLAVSGAPQARATGVDRSRVETDREQPARQVLFADAIRQEAARA